MVRATSADFPRTRLTHSLECAQIGRELGQEIGCDPDLVDAALAWRSDIGHSPFGHNGEAALNELARRHRRLRGQCPDAAPADQARAQDRGRLASNLTRATLDATLKYPWFGEPGTKFGAHAEDAEVFGWIRQGAPDRSAVPEAQVMDWADDVAYSVHDMEDGFHASLITFKNLKSQTERAEVSRTAIAYCPGGCNRGRAHRDPRGAARPGHLARLLRRRPRDRGRPEEPDQRAHRPLLRRRPASHPSRQRIRPHPTTATPSVTPAP